MEIIEIEKSVSELAIENSMEIDENGLFLDVDSFSFVSFLVSVEDKFDIIFPDSSLNQETVNSIGDISNVVSFLLEEKNENEKK